MSMFTETVSVTSSSLSAAGPCAHATQAQRYLGLSAPWDRQAVRRGSGRPPGQRAACKSTGDGRERGRRPCLRAPPHSPAGAGLFVGRRSATAAVHAPGLRWHTGGRGRVRLRHGASQPAWRRSVQRCGLSRPRPRPPVCQRLQRYLAARCPGGLPSLRAPHGLPVPWRCRCGAARLRGMCAPSAAEPSAAAATQQGRPAGRPQVIAYSVVTAPAT